MAESGAGCIDSAAVEFNYRTDDGQTDAEPTDAFALVDAHLGKQFEHVGQFVGRYSDARVFDAHHLTAVFLRQAHANPPARLGILGRILDQVRNDLRQTRRVTAHAVSSGLDLNPDVVPA